jgi:predicted DNA-binding transcriptional regulator YafY
MKFVILLDIFFELLAKRKVTAGYLAQKHELSVRTIYRYVDILSMTVPIYIQQGRNGGICISDSYKLPKGFMTKEEYEAAIEALSAMYSQLPEERFLAAQRKLSSQIKAEIRDLTLSGELGSIIVDNSSWGDSRFADNLRFMEECIRDKKVLEIDYRSRVGESTKRKIEPHVLVFKQGIWYVYAYCRMQSAFRLFRIGRIFSSFLTDETFEKRAFKREDIPLNYWSNEVKSVSVLLEFSESVIADAQDWLGVENLQQRGEKLIAEVELPDDEILIKKLLSFGSGVTVKSPEEIKNKVLTEAKKLLALYE